MKYWWNIIDNKWVKGGGIAREIGIHYIFLIRISGNPLSLFDSDLSSLEIFSSEEGSPLFFRILADGNSKTSTCLTKLCEFCWDCLHSFFMLTFSSCCNCLFLYYGESFGSITWDLCDLLIRFSLLSCTFFSVSRLIPCCFFFGFPEEFQEENRSSRDGSRSW